MASRKRNKGSKGKKGPAPSRHGNLGAPADMAADLAKDASDERINHTDSGASLQRVADVAGAASVGPSKARAFHSAKPSAASTPSTPFRVVGGAQPSTNQDVSKFVYFDPDLIVHEPDKAKPTGGIQI